MKNILWILTGGTIACTKKEGQGLSPESDSGFIHDMLSMIPDNFNLNVKPQVLFNLDSTNIGSNDWQKIAGAVFNSRGEYDGFVITHGTDTMQYTSAALSLMLQNFDKPVIITGSQKPFNASNDNVSDDNSDAPFNFISAFACSAKIKSGVYVCFGGRIISGESAVKLYSRRIDSFIDAAGDFGKAVRTTENQSNSDITYDVELFKEPAFLTSEPALLDKLCEDVFYLKTTPNTKIDIIEYIRNSGYRGVVCEAFGLGGVPEHLLSEISKLCRVGIRVVLVSQCVYEGVDLGIYNVGIKALESGLESGGNMTGSFALIRLMWELGNGITNIK